ncbi:MAG: hypothetical protein V7K77_08110 [Nostoc sp.]|uniref:hypothetical protein n=1 Tax=Nostoc sp. TaxID=1180 RepID=UPI002FFC4276
MLPPLHNYDVHTSLKIRPITWFRHLALGCAIALEAWEQGVADKQSQKLKGLCDYFAPLSLRS